MKKRSPPRLKLGAAKGPYARDAEAMRAAVLELLNDPEWQQWANRVIALELGCSHSYVGKVRRSLGPDHPANTTERKHYNRGETAVIDVTKHIARAGKKRPPAGQGWE